MIKNVIYSQLEGLMTDTEWKGEPNVDFSVFPSFDVSGFKITHIMNLKEELKDFPLSHFFSTVTTAPLGIMSFVAIKEISEEKNVMPPIEARHELDALVTCFRLFQSGYVGWGISFFLGSETKFGNMFGNTLRDSGGGRAYRLKEANIPEFVKYAEKVFPIVLELGKNKGELMFKFFNRGLNDTLRWEFKASLVDYFISLESLFRLQKNNSMNDSILKASIINGDSVVDRVDTYKKLRLIKDKRNKIVHGAYKHYDMNELQEDCTFLERVIRKNLRIILNYEVSGKGYDGLLKDLDRTIYGCSKEFTSQ